MKRTQISLTDEERVLLDRESARTGRSMASLIREAVHLVYAPDDVAEDLAVLDRAAGSWGDDHADGEAYVESIRTGRSWDRAE